MATHSSTLAWRIPWTEEPGGLQSTGRKESDTTERLSAQIEQKSQEPMKTASGLQFEGKGSQLPVRGAGLPFWIFPCLHYYCC